VTVTESQLLLARLRAEGFVSASALVGTDAAADAAAVGRRIVRLDDRVCLAWQDGFEPTAGGPAAATVSDFAALVLAVLLGLCWHDSAEEPWPGEPLGRGAIDRIAEILNRDRTVVLKFVARLRAVGLAEDTDDGGLRLGPQIAAWPPRTVAELRRQHHLLAAARQRFEEGAQ
jgi:hypothetical protein